MVGNDIIDILETKRTSNWERPGFVGKIFTQEEQAMIAHSRSPFTTVWQLWSMKESAYKVFIQTGGKCFFNPRKMKCEIETNQVGKVKIDNLILTTNSIINSDYIFSTAVVENSLIDTAIFQLPENNFKQQSNFTHRQFLIQFSKINTLDIQDLQIQKSNTGVPVLKYKNKQLNTSISLTHHGKFGAYSILIN